MRFRFETKGIYIHVCVSFWGATNCRTETTIVCFGALFFKQMGDNKSREIRRYCLLEEADQLRSLYKRWGTSEQVMNSVLAFLLARLHCGKSSQ